MAIPARNVGGVEAGHGLRLHHEVFKAFIERVAEVDRPVGIGRPIVQYLAGGILAHRANLLVETLLLPGGQSPRLSLGQFAFIGKSVLG